MKYVCEYYLIFSNFIKTAVITYWKFVNVSSFIESIKRLIQQSYIKLLKNKQILLPKKIKEQRYMKNMTAKVWINYDS